MRIMKGDKMMREKLDELLKSQFGDSTEIKEDSIKFKKSNIDFVAGKGDSLYYFSTEKASYEVNYSYDVEVSGSPTFETAFDCVNNFYNSNYKIESLKLRN